MKAALACIATLALVPAAHAAPTTSRDAQIAAARAALDGKEEDRAITLLEQADADFPDDPEILRLLGSAHAFAGHYSQAIATLKRAQELAPDDNDVRAALARSYLWSGDRKSAEAVVAQIERHSPQDAEAAAIRRQLAPTAEGSAAFGVALGQGFSHVSFDNRSSQNWTSTTLAVFGRVARGTTLALAAEREDRRSFVDTRIEGRIDEQIGSQIRTYIAVAGTPHADFREKWGISGGIEADAAPFATLLADVRHAEYRDVSVTSFLPGVRLTSKRLDVSATVRMINLWDERGAHRSGVSGRIDGAFSSGATLYGGAAAYPDTEAGITRQVRSFFIGGTVPLAHRITLRAGLDYDRRRTSYTRKGGSVGLQFGF